MNVSDKFKLALSTLFLITAGTAIAQDDADDEAEVILTIEEQWDAEQKGDSDWIDERLVNEFSGWPKIAPAPRTKSSTRKWDRFSDSQGETIEHELYFQNIIVRGDVAVAHYFYTSAYKNSDNKVEVSNGRYTDVLVRTEDGWKFLAWHGGDDE